MKLNAAVFSLFGVHAFAFTLFINGKTVTNLNEIEPPVLVETSAPDLKAPLLQSAIAEPLPPQETHAEAGTPAKRYRTAVEELTSHRHWFVRFKLRNGKVLTGLIRGVGQEGFTLHTDGLGGPYIRHEEIAQQPRAVSAVGTRIKHGAEWTGLGVVVAAAIPLLIVFSPFVYMSGWNC